MRCCRARHIPAAFQVHRNHCVEIFLGHLVKDDITEIAGVVHHAVDPAVQIQGLLHDLLRRWPIARHCRVLAQAMPPASQISLEVLLRGDRHFRQSRPIGRRYRSRPPWLPAGAASTAMALPTPAAGTGYDDDFSVQYVHGFGSR